MLGREKRNETKRKNTKRTKIQDKVVETNHRVLHLEIVSLYVCSFFGLLS